MDRARGHVRRILSGPEVFLNVYVSVNVYVYIFVPWKKNRQFSFYKDPDICITFCEKIKFGKK